MNVKSLLLTTSLTLLVGCTGTSNQQPIEGGDEAHAHSETGPHGQPLIELAGGDYHAELVHDDAAGTVTIYLLDSTAREAVAIDATEATLNLKHGETPEQFTLSAQPTDEDPEGKSSRFVSDDSHLVMHLEEGGEGELVVTVGGTPYRGKVKFEHEHGAHDEEHDHDHADGEKD